MIMRGKIVFLLFVALGLAFPPLARGEEDLTAKLKKYDLTSGDLPSGWSLGKVSNTLRGGKHIPWKQLLDHMKKSIKGFDFGSHKVTANGTGFNVFVIVTEKGTRNVLEGTVKANAKNWKYTYFKTGEALVMAETVEEDLVKELKAIFTQKFAVLQCDAVRALLAEGKIDEAEELMDAVLEANPGSISVAVLLAAVYVDDFKPPRLDDAVELYDRILAEAKKRKLDDLDLLKAYRGRGRIHELNHSLSRAEFDLEKTLEIATRIGLRTRAKALFDIARVKALADDADACLEKLKESLHIETMFGSKEILGLVRAEKAFAEICKSGAGKALLDKCAMAKAPDGIADPKVGKLGLRKVTVLIAPPLVLKGSFRDATIEDNLEAELKKKFSKRGFIFGRKKVLLGRMQKMKGYSTKFLDAAEKLVFGSGNFDLAGRMGDTLGLKTRLDDILEEAQDRNVTSSEPETLLCCDVKLAESGSKTKCRVRVCLVVTETCRVAVMIRFAMEFSTRSLKSKMKGLPRPIMRKLGDTLKGK
jgi:tetratricopeptide (TPR) repeat protein